MTRELLTDTEIRAIANELEDRFQIADPQNDGEPARHVTICDTIRFELLKFQRTREQQPAPVQPSIGIAADVFRFLHQLPADLNTISGLTFADGKQKREAVANDARRLAGELWSAYGSKVESLMPTQHRGDTITSLEQMTEAAEQPRRRYDAYVWQMNDGRWHISECTNARLRGFPALPFGIPGFETEAEARAHLRKLEDELDTQR